MLVLFGDRLLLVEWEKLPLHRCSETCPTLIQLFREQGKEEQGIVSTNQSSKNRNKTNKTAEEVAGSDTWDHPQGLESSSKGPL
jgi:hypothetical protein